MEFHETATIFPMMDEGEYQALKSDIAEHGLRESIWTWEGKIIDGRNRWKVCQELGIEPRTRPWSGDGSLVAFIVSMNLHRRHLMASQRAMVAVDMLPALEAEAKKRQGTRTDLTSGNKLPDVEFGKSSEKAATMARVSKPYVIYAKKLTEQAPDLAKQVRTGDKTITAARRELIKRARQECPPLLTEGKYRVLYADPPWHYGNAGLDEYGHAEHHYPTMHIQELCEMGDAIETISEPNAVLFLWVTSPLLAECFEVVHAWGFKYKTSFVWDKVLHNHGHYNSVRHEFLLICTRGNCTPDDPKLFDSVQTIERSRTHSEKPEEFRAIIDTLYTHGNRIELFARKQTIDGWDAWGNEPN